MNINQEIISQNNDSSDQEIPKLIQESKPSLIPIETNMARTQHQISFLPFQIIPITIVTALLSWLSSLLPSQLWFISFTIHLMDIIICWVIIQAMRKGKQQNLQHHIYPYHQIKGGSQQKKYWHLLMLVFMLKFCNFNFIDWLFCFFHWLTYVFWALAKKLNLMFILAFILIISFFFLSKNYFLTIVLLIHWPLGLLYRKKISYFAGLTQNPQLCWFTASLFVFTFAIYHQIHQFWSYLILWSASVVIGSNSQSSIKTVSLRYKNIIVMCFIILVSQWIASSTLGQQISKESDKLIHSFNFYFTNLICLLVLYLHLTLQKQLFLSNSNRRSHNESFILKLTLLNFHSSKYVPSKFHRLDSLYIQSIETCISTLEDIIPIVVLLFYNYYGQLYAYSTSRIRMATFEEVINYKGRLWENAQMGYFLWVLWLWFLPKQTFNNKIQKSLTYLLLILLWIPKFINIFQFSKYLISLTPLKLLLSVFSTIHDYQNIYNQIHSCNQTSVYFLNTLLMALITINIRFYSQSKYSLTFFTFLLIYFILVFNVYNWVCVQTGEWVQFWFYVFIFIRAYINKYRNSNVFSQIF